ncbi:penicillin-binding protein [Colletotrichum scovillei]|uniref:Penicillin-binding protein n=1 Tax=Colletotrichum scovillei TaxID=1209932 RepID=A0A9P7RGG8_9PEZI|nr:penicillin-binding protein [Colletotrichum scovillei]KAG7075406.1 penicillin-binding protein [Colletotrichum scovillei]
MKHFRFPIAALWATQALGQDIAQRPLHDEYQAIGDVPRVVSKDLDEFIERIREEWHAPGLAVAIVDGNNTWAKGYGYAVLNSTPVTPHTLYYTGSTTKSFTAAGISLLIDNASATSSVYPGLNWKTPVSHILRDDFVLSDEWATAHITLEDAMSHRTGYPSHDLAPATTAQGTTRLLRHLPMAAEPRTTFLYNNKMFGAMGYLIEVLTGSWLGDFFREYLWEPMGMNETYFSLKDAERSGLVLAKEYYYDPDDGSYLQLPHEPSSGEEGAGSIISNVLDYAKYLRIMMTESAPISKAGHREVKTPRTLVAPAMAPFTGPVSYALGWNTAILGGEQVYFHTGGVNMFISMMMMIPSQQIGVVVFTNTDVKAPQVIATHILSEHLGIPKYKRPDMNEQLSQQAFRRRQAERMRELSSRVNTDQKSDNERIEDLQRENRQLRAQLVDVQARMSRLLANIQGLSDSVSKTLNDTGSQGSKVFEETEDHASQLSTYDKKQTYDEGPPFPGPSMQLEPFDTSSLNFDPPLAHHPGPGQSEDAFLSSELINVTGTSPLYTQIPNIWSFEYQTGIEPYLTAMAASQESSMALRKDMPISNSPFSDHIKLLQHLLKSKLAANGFDPDSQPSMQSIYQPVLMVLSMFNSMTRPDVMAWYAKTRFFHIIELTAWQLYPSRATFQKLHQRYRPTDTQLKHPHPRVIDWIPFPSIRDRLIELHAANPLIDQIFCDAVSGYVVEAVMSELISDAPQITVYVRVTDLIAAMSLSSGAGNNDTPASLPAPDITTLFSSPSHARAAFKLLNMDKGASYYKIDPAFYAKYPELYDQSNDLTANGVPLKPRSQKVLTYPKPLDDSMVETYRSFIDFSMDATSTISSTTAS